MRARAHVHGLRGGLRPNCIAEKANIKFCTSAFHTGSFNRVNTANLALMRDCWQAGPCHTGALAHESLARLRAIAGTLAPCDPGTLAHESLARLCAIPGRLAHADTGALAHGSLARFMRDRWQPG